MNNPIKYLEQNTKARIIPIPHGVKMMIGIRTLGRTVFIGLVLIPAVMIMLVVASVVNFLVIGAIAAIIIKIAHLPSPPPPLLEGAIVLTWGIGVVICVAYMMYRFLKDEATFVNNELVLSKGSLTIRKTFFGVPFGQAQHYPINFLTNIHITPTDLCFTSTLDPLQPITFEHSGALYTRQSDRFVQQFSEMLAYHSYSVEQVLFGAYSSHEHDPYGTLHNPNVSTLTTPLIHLKHICIDTESYDFHMVEQFLTYAVNYIGQSYLKKHVTVSIDGDRGKLHPHLRNNLTNLCKQVTIHSGDQ